MGGTLNLFKGCLDFLVNWILLTFLQCTPVLPRRLSKHSISLNNNNVGANVRLNYMFLIPSHPAKKA